MDFKGKKVTVVGLGKSGFAAACFLACRGAKVRASDASEHRPVLENAARLKKLGVETETGRHTTGFAAGSDWVVTSPGVPKHNPILAFAAKKRIPVISEIELASFSCPGKIVAVTGSNGKTTTSRLLHRIFADARRQSIVCGNIGFSFLDALGKIRKRTVVVLEVSSFQLEDSPSFRPDVAVVLNVSPNHLDRHKTFQSYVRAKEKIFRNQKKSDWLVLNHEDPVVRRMASKARSRVVFYGKRPLGAGVFIEHGRIVRLERGRRTVLAGTGRFRLRGAHNLENILAASAVASIFRVPRRRLQKTLDSFETLEHRLEPIGSVAGVHFMNDSKSTTVDSTRAAIEAVEGPLILVAGGRETGAAFARIEPVLERRVKHAVLYGEARAKIAAAWKSFDRFQTLEKFEEAVRFAFEKASPGDSVLLSPMCASFDQFSSFEDRGRAFKKVFRKLRAEWKR